MKIPTKSNKKPFEEAKQNQTCTPTSCSDDDNQNRLKMPKLPLHVTLRVVHTILASNISNQPTIELDKITKKGYYKKLGLTFQTASPSTKEKLFKDMCQKAKKMNLNNGDFVWRVRGSPRLVRKPRTNTKTTSSLSISSDD